MLAINDIVIDREFSELIPPLSADERTQLMLNIERDGFHGPIVVWKHHAILIDGHNRMEIWRDVFDSDAENKPVVLELGFQSRDDVVSWIVTNQLGRRNLTDAMRVKLSLRLKLIYEAQAKLNQKQSQGRGAKGSANLVHLKTMAKVAEIAHVSESTARKVEAVLAKGDDKTKSRMLCGDTSVEAAHKTVAPKSKPVGPIGLKVARGVVAFIKKTMGQIPTDDSERQAAFDLVGDAVVGLL